MNEINEIKIPKGVKSISVTQHDDKVVIEFIPKEHKFKEGDFVYEDGRIMIIDKFSEKGIRHHALIYPAFDLDVVYNRPYALTTPLSSLSFRPATDEEKQLLIDAMEKDGKRWNAYKKCIEDIPKSKFKVGDKVRIKDGISSKTHRYVSLNFTESMDEFIGKELTVKMYHNGFVILNGDECVFLFDENWIEPYTDEPKKGDLSIFWDNDGKNYATIRLYDKKENEYHYDNFGIFWGNAIKFESKEQYEKILKWEG